MLSWKKCMGYLPFLLLILFLLPPLLSVGRPWRPARLPDEGKNFRCSTCHFNPEGGGPRNPFGQDWEAIAIPLGDEYVPEIANRDSDGDGFTNDEEFNAGTHPGDSDDHPEPPEPPTVDAGGPYRGNEGQSITLTASVTEAPADTLTFEWDLDGDGSYDDADGTTTTISFTDNGNFTVSVKATDEHGGSSTDSASVTVNNAIPVVNAGSDQTMNEGDVVNFDGSFTDSGSVDTHTIAWNFGDGETASGILTPTHVYADNGVYTATLTITDDDGGVGTDTLTVTVINVAPVANTDGPYEGIVGEPIQLQSSATDVNSDQETLTYEWDFNYDGTTFDVDSTERNPMFPYETPGDHTVALRVRDKDGGISELSLANVSVLPPLKPWDINSDGEVNILDLVLVAENFGKEGVDIQGDVNEDGVVDISDLVIVGKHFGENK